MDKITFRTMVISDYNQLIELFEKTPGITLRDADSFESTKTYLKRNPELSYVAEYNDKIIGCVMCGHDGRRGYLQHLLVIPEFRNNGIGEILFKKCLLALEKINIYKTHLFVLKNNSLGNKFWVKRGWKLRDDINIYSYNNSKNPNI